MMKLLREPLVHFLALGAGLFLLFGVVGDSPEAQRDSIVVSEGQVAQLVEGWTRTWQRPPTERELQGLIEDHIREEVYYREALAMGLDRDDTIVRRRLRQKLEFITDDLIDAVDPTDEQLVAYLTEHPDKFRIPSRLSFDQIYFNSDRRGEQALRDAEALLAQLSGASSDVDISDLGDTLMLPEKFEMFSEHEIARELGSGFAIALGELPIGHWAGPVPSGFGLHLVRVREKEHGSVASLDEARDAVEREWRTARRQETTDRFYQGLRERYEVSVEALRAGEDETGTARVAEVER